MTMRLPTGLGPAAPTVVVPPNPVTWQDTQKVVTGTQRQPPIAIWDIRGQRPKAVTIQSTAKAFNPGPPIKAARGAGCFLFVQWGAGNQSYAAVFPANKPITLVATYVSVSPMIQAAGPANGGTINQATYATFRVVISDGDVSPTLTPSQWIVSSGQSGNPLDYVGQLAPPQTYSPGLPLSMSVTLLRCFGANCGTTTGYFMLFDFEQDPTASGAGRLPAFMVPVPAGSYFSYDFASSGRVFQAGCWWAISSTPDVLTPDVAALFRVDAEIQAYEQS